LAPAWVTAGLEGLRPKYPSDLFEADHDSIKCLDCDRLFKFGKGVNNFETHLRSKTHRTAVDSRLEKQRQADTFMSTTDTFMPTSKTIDFEMTAEPLMVYAQSHSSLDQARNRYFAELERKTNSSDFWIYSMQKRLSNLETNYKSHAEQQSEILEISKSVDGKYQAVSDANASLREEQKNQFAQLKYRLSESEETQEHKNRKTEERFETFEEKQSNRVIALQCKLKDFEEHSEDQLKENAKRIARAERRHKEEFEDIRNTLVTLEEDKKKQLDQISEQNKKELDQMMEPNKQQLAEMSEKLDKLEVLTKTQESTITDLEFQVQLHAEELQRHRDNEEILQQNLSAQMTVQAEQTDCRLKAIEEASEERLERFERQLLERMRSVDKQKSERIRSVEKENSELRINMERFENVMPALFEEFRALREIVGVVEEDSEEAEAGEIEPAVEAP